MEGKGEVVMMVVVVLGAACMVGGVVGRAYDPRPDPSLYNIGVGIYDVTGPAAGVNMVSIWGGSLSLSLSLSHNRRKIDDKCRLMKYNKTKKRRKEEGK